MIGKSQNESRNGWNNIWFRGCNPSQFNYREPIPPYGRGFHHGGDRYLPPQTSGPTIPIVAPLRRPPPVCKICEVKMSSHKNIEQHNNGKRHQRMLELHEESRRQKTINGQQSGQMPNSLINLVVQPKTVKKSKKNGCLVENVSSAVTIDKHKDYLQKDIAKTSEVLVEKPEGEPRDNYAAQGHGFRRKISGATGVKYMKTNNGKRRLMESSKPDVNAVSNYVESQVQVPAVAPTPGSVASQIIAPTPLVGSSSKLLFQHASASQIQMSEGKAHHEIKNHTVQTNDQPQSISVELHAPAVSSINTQTEDVSSDSVSIAIAPPQGHMASQVFANAVSNYVGSQVQVPAVAPPPWPVASQILTPTPVLGSSSELQFQYVSSSQIQVSEGKAHREIKNPTVQTNDQPQSILVELHAPAGSSINTQTEDVSSDSASIAIAPPQGPVVSQIGKSQNESRNGWNNIWFRGCNPSQFNYREPIPAYGRGFHHGGDRYLPPQTSGPTIPIVAPLRRPPPVCKICEVKMSSHKNIEQHNNGKRHQRMLELHEESRRQKTINGQRSGQMPNSLMNLVVQPKRVKKSKKNGCLVENVSSAATIDKHKDYLQKDIEKTSEVLAEKPEGEPRDNFAAQGHGFRRKISGATGVKYMKTNNGKRRLMESSKPDVNAVSNYVESQVQVPAVAPPPWPVASQIMAPTPVVGSSSKLLFQHASASQIQVSEGKAHHEIKNHTVQANDQPQSMSVELHAPAGSSINTQTEDVSSDSASIAIAPPQGHMASQVFANAVSNYVGSQVQVPAVAPPPWPVASQILTPTPVVGSSSEVQFQHVSASLIQVSEGKAHHEIKNATVQTNDQPQSISVELHAPTGSSINTQTEDVSSDSASIAIAPPQGPVVSQVFAPPTAVGSSFEAQIQHVLHTEIEPQVSKAIAHNESQNPTGETNSQLPSSVLVEFDAPAGSSTNTQTADGSSQAEENMDVFATELGITKLPQVFAPPTAVGSSFEPQIQHVLHTETETQVSEAIEHNDSQNPTDETNIQLPSSVLVEIDAPAGSSTNSQTTYGSSQVEEKIDVFTADLGITQIPQVAVCLKCGDEGFPEALVYCNKCQVYGLHRYCLDGAVIFLDDVTWFCEDCEEKVEDTSSHDQSTHLPSGTSDSVNLAKDANQPRIELTICIESVKEDKQQQQNTVAKTKVLLPDSHNSSHHGWSQCSNNCEEENKLKKECQPVPKDAAANSSEGSVSVQNSRVATNDHLNFVESVGHAEPIADPIWRGNLCLHNQSVSNLRGLLAHMSSLACSKVLEETRLFPEVLCVDLLERSVVWPKGFINCGPTDDSIALYFFPVDERVEREFDKLVDDIIYQDLAMRAMVENAELLVFPSTVLPLQHRRFQAKYYLWGVFRAKPTSPETNEDTGVDKPLTQHNHIPSNTF